MSNFAPEAHIQQYTNRTGVLLQQMGSKLKAGCRVESYTGKQAQVVVQYGAVEGTEIVNRHADTQLTDTPMTSRWIRPSDWGVADMVDREDLIRSLTDPKSELAMVQAMGLGRKQDDLILSGMYGTNFTGQDGATSTTFAADGGTVLPVNPISAAQMRLIRKTFRNAEVDLDREVLIWALTADEEEDLFAISEYINGQQSGSPFTYHTTNNAQPLVDGRIRPFLGFNFITCERIPVNGSNQNRTMAWVKRAAVFGNWNTLQVDVGPRADKWNNMQVATKGSWGFTRTEGAMFVEAPAAP
jgi:hypothetical protein